MNPTKSLEVILLTGQSGVGKTSAAYEIMAILKSKNIKHALIDTDELDHIYPAPSDPENFSERTLKLISTQFTELGCDKLVLCAVLADITETPVWIKRGGFAFKAALGE